MTERDRSDEMGTDDTGPGDDVESLLGAYAVDAVDEVERRRVERLLATDADRRAEADRLATAADHLAEAASSGTTAPPGLWDAIAARIDEPTGTARPTTSPAPAVSPSSGAVPIQSAPSRR
ncbi:MAG TPA: hypothetical protein VIY72_09775, partial [Acidimicrobiales bacterium]